MFTSPLPCLGVSGTEEATGLQFACHSLIFWTWGQGAEECSKFSGSFMVAWLVSTSHPLGREPLEPGRDVVSGV